MNALRMDGSRKALAPLVGCSALFLLVAACADVSLAPGDTAPESPEVPSYELGSQEGHRLDDTRLAPPEEEVCVRLGDTPVLPEQAEEEGFVHALTLRQQDLGEIDASLPEMQADTFVDELELGPSESAIRSNPQVPQALLTANLSSFWVWWFRDDDGDCLMNGAEYVTGTNVWNPDTDGDGWFDGPCNERRRLVLERIYARDEQEDIGDDEHYLIVDDTRYPQVDLDDYWNFDDGDSRNFDLVIAERTRGTNRSGWLRTATIEGWEDDVEVFNTWTVDDYLYRIDLNLGAYSNGQRFSVRRRYSDWDYELTFRVEVEAFADPNPTADGDSDGDGIRESAEFAVARDFGGITDPESPDILVEVDWMGGHGLRTQSKRLVVTQLARHGYDVYIHRNQSLSYDDCLTRDEARQLYLDRFTYSRYDAFRYAVMSELIWNDASGVAIGDAFFVDDSTWWINNGVLAQAGTFIHELGHTLSLTKSTFRLIDTVAWLSYDSAMNYTYQATMVDYSSSGSGGSSSDHNDWVDVNPAYALQYSFGLSSTSNDGICD